MNVQHVNVKIYAHEGAGFDIGGAIPVFHRWIQGSAADEVLIDVADYRHVPAGPGILLIGHHETYSLDLNRNRLGLLYNRKTALEGDTAYKLRQAFQAALSAAQRLEREPEFAGKLRFDAGEVDFIFNDRLLVPNSDESAAALRPEVEKLLNEVYGLGSFHLEARSGDRRERLQFSAKTARELGVSAVIEALASAPALQGE
jgi:hypothetical protein